MTEHVKATRINGVQYNYPICHRCKVQVAAFTWCDHRNDAARMLALAVVGDDTLAPVMRTFFALCHGETDTVSIPLEELSKGQGVGVGEAFLPKDPWWKLPGAPRLSTTQIASRLLDAGAPDCDDE